MGFGTGFNVLVNGLAPIGVRGFGPAAGGLAPGEFIALLEAALAVSGQQVLSRSFAATALTIGGQSEAAHEIGIV